MTYSAIFGMFNKIHKKSFDQYIYTLKYVQDIAEVQESKSNKTLSYQNNLYNTVG